MLPSDVEHLELPMQPTIAALLVAAFVRQQGRAWLLARLPVVVVGAWLSYTALNSPGSIWFAVAVLAVLVFVVSMATMLLWSATRDIVADRGERTYLRTSGAPTCIAERDSEGLLVTYELGGQMFQVDGSLAAQLEACDWVTVDHTRHARLILAVWNERDVLVHCQPGYVPPVR